MVDGEKLENLGLELPIERGTTWVSRVAGFDSLGEEIEVKLRSFNRRRRLEVLVGDGKFAEILEQRSAMVGHEMNEGAWAPAGEVPGEAWIGTDPTVLRFRLSPEENPQRITLRMAGCNSPAELGLSDDRRCLSFLILESQGLSRAREVSQDLVIPAAPRTLRLALPRDGRKKRVTLRPDTCGIPAELGLSDDPRCLAFRLAAPELWRIELFDNLEDPGQASDLSSEKSDLSLSLLRKLERHRPEPVAPAATLDLDPELEERLRSLGYLQ